MTHQRYIVALAAIALFFSAACTHATPRGAAVPASHGVDFIDVENRTPDDLTIYLLRDGGVPIRIGRVPALASRKLQVSPGMIMGSDLQLRAVRGVAHYGRGIDVFDPARDRLAMEPGGRTTYGTLPFTAPADGLISWTINPVLPVTGVS